MTGTHAVEHSRELVMAERARRNFNQETQESLQERVLGSGGQTSLSDGIFSGVGAGVAASLQRSGLSVTMGMGSMIGAEIFLSWIGLGIQPPRPSLGVMLWESGNISVIRTEPWLMFAPGSVAFLMVLAWNLLGDALNDVFNPRTY